jgi:hypothetical protein
MSLLSIQNIFGANVAEVEHPRRVVIATFGGDISPYLDLPRAETLEAL